MSMISQTVERIYRYLKDILSDRERHDLEKEMMEDAFNEDAFEGLSQLDASAFNSDMDNLYNRLDRRVASEKKIRPVTFYRIAATLLFIAAIGTILYMMFNQKPETRELSQEIQKEIPAEIKIPEAPGSPVEKQVSVKKPGNTHSQTGSEKVVTPKADQVEEEEVIEFNKEIITPESAATPAESREASGDLMAVMPDSVVSGYVTGRILGVDNQALAGASIAEKGSMQRTVTDINGNFKLKVTDAGSKISISSVGYKPVEVPTREMGGREITMSEDLAALNDITVVGYGQGKKSKTTRYAESVDSLSAGFGMPYKYTKPVPPQGTLQAFEKWAEGQLDVEKLMDLEPGNYKILVNLTVNANGTISQVTITNEVPAVVKEEYKRAVESSPVWQPARSDNNPVQSEIEIIFSLTVE